jgi:hypothetical protein
MTIGKDNEIWNFLMKPVAYTAMLAALLNPNAAQAAGDNNPKENKPGIEKEDNPKESDLENISIRLSNGKTVPAAYLKKVREMPDFCQIQQGLPKNGAFYCGPASAANFLIWLDNNGFDNLIPGDSNDPKARFGLVKKLGEKDYLNTGASGTSLYFLMKGLEKYIQDQGYDVKVEHKGARFRAERYHASDQVDLPWLLEGVQGNSNILLDIGFYKKENGAYVRKGGHFVTVAGYVIDENKVQLVIHDPSARTGKQAKHEYCQLVPMGDENLVEHGRSAGAAGYYMLKGLSRKGGTDIAVVDCAFRFGVSGR